ncbi:hypothetical protein M407DRAFT_73753 [Tulasnella calospora MUT 4182]|uniref:DNA mismatch repair proteins mutS family domain-containing protein n=1 Tax=Tulasnella calospora MUT 4182 TaxID=1051891 RepID=A0A0C3L056_9AGAM|nr:hypothetical protein M407DRAFT_73753 [Tulasnella calospora MUT 4182]
MNDLHSIPCSRGRIGAAFFDPAQRTMHLLEDTCESNHFDLTRMILEQLCPDVILSSSRADEALIRECQIYMDETSGRFRVRPHKEFSPEQGREKMLSLRIVSEIKEYEDPSLMEQSVSRNAYDFMGTRNGSLTDSHMNKWAASIRAFNFATITAPLCASPIMSAAGALLDYLVRIHATTDLTLEGIEGLDIVDIRPLSLQKSMLINVDALHSLQVFSSESHASIHSDKTKEGLSLFAGILDHTRTKSGRALLKRWLLRPSLDIQAIRSRHDALDCFLLGENLPSVDALHSHLRGLRNTPRTITALKNGKAGIREWTALVKFTYHVIMLEEALSELSCSAGVDIIERVRGILNRNDFKILGALINETIDWEASLNEARVCVRYHVDPLLDDRKRIYDSLSIFLAKVAQRIGEGVPLDVADNLNVIYFPQLGYLITIPLRDEWRHDTNTEIVQGWTFQFSTECHVYFKNQDMHGHDCDHSQIVHFAPVAREIEIIHGLQEKVLERDTLIKETCDVCAELDCLLSFATASRLYNWIRPEISEMNILDIKNGRHPLQELCESSFVPNDISLTGSGVVDVEDSTGDNQALSVLICTGPNACGKSIYLKQNAIIPIMSQIGCFVPAERARLGIIDKIFTRVQTKESVGKIQSAFMIDLAQVSLALRNCTARSLVVMDEFGKGTMPSDGAGLLCGVLRYFLSRSYECPMVLVATHFHELFRNNFLPSYLPAKFSHMQVIIADEIAHSVSGPDARGLADPANVEDELDTEVKGQLLDNFTFLFRVAPGLCLKSHAAQCAMLNGVPRKVVQRAQRVRQVPSFDHLVNQNIMALLDEQMTEKELEELREAEAVTRRFCSLDLGKSANLRLRLAEVVGRQPS